MKGQKIMFERGLNAPDGIHPTVEFNEYRPDGTRWVTIGQLFCGTMLAFGMLLAYIFVGILEG